jgi:antitoxin ParD1/3/4
MNVSLTPALKKFVAAKVRAGQYASADEVVRDALRSLRAQEETSAADVIELRREIAIGLNQLDGGEKSAFTAKDIQKIGRKILASRKASSEKRKRAS